ncbi:MAG: glycosyltransferase family 9 protein [Candidatus Omnitrophica bacterium]|nr:glycosyltransferase family 9 protein [Candidatus Omnitrophota bacterium]
MRINTIRWLDKRLGAPLCFTLTLQRKIKDIFGLPGSRELKTNPRILFIKLSEQGSTILALPAIERATELAGKDNLYFLVFKENRPILDLLEVIPPRNTIEIDTRNFWIFLLSFLKAVSRIRKERIDACLDMEFFSRGSAILSYLSGAKVRVGLHSFTGGPYRGDLLTHRLLYNPYLHTKIFFLSEVEALKITPPKEGPLSLQIPAPQEEHFSFNPSAAEMRALLDKLEKLKKGKLSKPVIIFNPNTSDLLPLRRWPEENFINLGKKILKDNPQATILMTGTLKEKERTDFIAEKIPGALSLAGQTSLGELLTLYCVADILITNDSGPAHFSCLTPVKAIILFGPETPLLYGPLCRNKEVIASPLACSPCINVYNQRHSSCKTGLCLKNITVEEVYAKIKSLLMKEEFSNEAVGERG